MAFCPALHGHQPAGARTSRAQPLARLTRPTSWIFPSKAAMFNCLLPCFPKERERRARVRRLQDQEAELDARERRLQEREARWFQAADGSQAALAAEKTLDAIQSLEAALGAWGGREEWGGDALREARRLLEAPCAKSAASALIVIGEVAQNCDEEAESAVMAAERAMRDVVVLQLALFLAWVPCI